MIRDDADDLRAYSVSSEPASEHKEKRHFKRALNYPPSDWRCPVKTQGQRVFSWLSNGPFARRSLPQDSVTMETRGYACTEWSATPSKYDVVGRSHARRNPLEVKARVQKGARPADNKIHGDIIRSWEATVLHSLKSRPGDENLTIVLDAANVARLRVKHVHLQCRSCLNRALRWCVRWVVELN